MTSGFKFESTSHILSEERVFTPTAQEVENANITAYMRSKGFTDYDEFYQWSLANHEEYWSDQAKELTWLQPWQKVFEWTEKPFFKWFSGGQCNIVYNCLDRHMGTPVENKVAYHWEGDNGDTQTITYRNLYNRVNRMAAALKQLGVQKGDRVSIY